MIHLYAIGREPVRPRLPGVDGAPVVTLAASDLHASISHHGGAVEATTEAALAHVAVIEDLARRTEVLPVRFGPTRSDVAGLRGELERASAELTRLLDRVGGHVEFVLRSAEPRAPVLAGSVGAAEGAHGGPGRAYLEGRRAAARAASDAQAARRDHLRRVGEPLDAAAVDVEDTVGRNGPERCFLVARDAAAAFAALAREVSDRAGDLVVGGPWPPFTFASPTADQLGRP